MTSTKYKDVIDSFGHVRRLKKLTVTNSSRYPTREVQRLVRFALSDIDTTGVHVNVKNSTGVRSGRAYYRVPGIANVPPGTRRLITIKIGPESAFPYEDGYWNSHAREQGAPRRGGRWPEKTLNDWREALVSVAAHEGLHIERHRERVKQSEIACEHFAAETLERYRRSYGPTTSVGSGTL